MPAQKRRFRYLVLMLISMGFFFAALLSIIYAQFVQIKEIKDRSSIYNDSAHAMVFQFERSYYKLENEIDKLINRTKDRDDVKNADDLKLRLGVFISKFMLIKESNGLRMVKEKPEFNAIDPLMAEFVSSAKKFINDEDLVGKDISDIRVALGKISIEVQSMGKVVDDVIGLNTEQQDVRMIKQSYSVIGVNILLMIIALSVMVSVINQQKRQAVKSKKIEEELEIRVSQRSEELRKAQVQLVHQEKMASLGQLVANIAHEINTPIASINASGGNITSAINGLLLVLNEDKWSIDNNILGLVIKLIQEASTDRISISSREERFYVDQAIRVFESIGIKDEWETASILIEINPTIDVLEYVNLVAHKDCKAIFNIVSKISSIISNSANINSSVGHVSKIVFALKHFSYNNENDGFVESDITENIEMVITIYGNNMRNNIDLTRNYKSRPKVDCIPVELQQVWNNLIHNSLQAMDYSGKLAIEVDSDDEYVTVAISDSGKGIPKDLEERIFESFFTTKPIGEGSGLGLGIVKSIIEKHKGEITFKSDVGIGTTFFVRLPLKQTKTYEQ